MIILKLFLPTVNILFLQVASKKIYLIVYYTIILYSTLGGSFTIPGNINHKNETKNGIYATPNCPCICKKNIENFILYLII